MTPKIIYSGNCSYHRKVFEAVNHPEKKQSCQVTYQPKLKNEGKHLFAPVVVRFPLFSRFFFLHLWAAVIANWLRNLGGKIKIDAHARQRKQDFGPSVSLFRLSLLLLILLLFLFLRLHFHNDRIHFHSDLPKNKIKLEPRPDRAASRAPPQGKHKKKTTL